MNTLTERKLNLMEEIEFPNILWFFMPLDVITSENVSVLFCLEESKSTLGLGEGECATELFYH